MNPNIAEQSLEALEIFYKNKTKRFPWTPEVGGWYNDLLIYKILEGSCFYTIPKESHHPHSNPYYMFKPELYLPTDRQLDQWLIDFNNKKNDYIIKHNMEFNRFESLIRRNVLMGRNIFTKFSYTSAEEQYLAKCQVIAKAFELTQESNNATD